MLKPKGTYDLYGTDAKVYEYLLDIFKGICETACFSYIKTPTFENTELFHRSVGEETDIVSKETYNFKDRSDRNLTLRPEGTAGVVRALVENKLYANTIDYLKYYYYGSMFRYERPQKGRFREFSQFGVESFGPMNPYIDAEIINIGYSYFTNLGLKDIVVKINNLGTKEERNDYKNKLIEYMNKYEDELCEDCKRRIKTNPLRVLDCKICSKKDFFKNTPKLSDSLTNESKKYFDELLEILNNIEIKYELDDNLVRGLDYYDYCVFEFITNDERLGGANTICGGGRYNGLVKELGGPDLSGCGFAIGYERLKELCEAIDITKYLIEEPLIYVIPVSNGDVDDAFIIGESLREIPYKTYIDYRDIKLNKKLANADKLNAKFIIIMGEEERKKYSVILKDALTKEERLISINNLTDELNILM